MFLKINNNHSITLILKDEISSEKIDGFKHFQVNEMKTINLDIDIQDLHYFTSFLNKEIMGYPVNSLRANGSYNYKKKRYNRKYKVTINKDEKNISFLIDLTVIKNKLNPIKISIDSKSL